MYKLFRRAIQFHPFGQRVLKRIMTLARCVVVASIPGPPSWLITWLWYRNVFVKHRHFHEMDNALTGEALGAFIFLFMFFATLIMSTSWREYKLIRAASKEGDIATIMVYRFERVSPLVYTFLIVVAGIVLFGFMGLNYSDAGFGIYTVNSFSYILILYFFVLAEIDNPFSGFWYIRSISPEILRIDARKYLEHLRIKRFDEWRRDLPTDHLREILAVCAEEEEDD